MNKALKLIIMLIILSITSIFLWRIVINKEMDDILIPQGSELNELDFKSPKSDGFIRELPKIFLYKDNTIGIFSPINNLIVIYNFDGEIINKISINQSLLTRVITGVDYSNTMGFVTTSIIDKDISKVFDESITEKELEKMGITDENFIQIHYGEVPGENLVSLDENVDIGDNGIVGNIFQDIDLLVESSGNRFVSNYELETFSINTDNNIIYPDFGYSLDYDLGITSKKKFKYTIEEGIEVILNTIYEDDNKVLAYTNNSWILKDFDDIELNQVILYEFDKDMELTRVTDQIIDIDINISRGKMAILVYDETNNLFIVREINF